MGASGRPKSCPKGVKTAKSGLGQGRWRGQDSNFEVFWPTLSQKIVFLEMYEKPEENTCFSRVREGPGAQVGATLAQKSHRRGVKTGKMTSNRVAGGVRAVKVRPVRLDCLSEPRKSLHLIWNSDQGEVKSYLSDQSYD